MIYHLYVELEGSKPLVWRRIVVPANYNLYQLHMALQGAFGWENSHLFEFCEKDLPDAIVFGIPDDQDSATEIVDARKTKMNNIFKNAGQKYRYIYDFGDYWKHQIIFEKSEAKEIDAPFCLGGQGACPPEDVGGMHGYHEMLEAFEKTGSKEREQYIQWLGLVEGEKWDAVFCSIREVNKRLYLLA